MRKLRAASLKTLLMTGLMLLGLTVSGVSVEAGSYLPTRHPIDHPDGAVALCLRYEWACAASQTDTGFGAKDMAVVRKVNTRVNRSTRQITDKTQYARTDVWALPTRRGGDCEDFALLKKRELIRAGIAPERLLIATVLDRNLGGHAVLVVRTHKGDMVLDNLSNRILSWQDTGYIFMKMQNPARPADWDAIIAGGPLLEARRS